MSTTYYVSQSGDDSDGSTLAKGKQTIAGGVALLSGGDTLIIDDADFPESIANSIPSGSAGFPTVIIALHANAATLYSVTLSGASYIIFDGIIADPTGSGMDMVPFECFPSASDHIIIKNGGAKNGGGTYGTGIDGLWESCQILNMDVVDNGDDPDFAHGIYISGSNNLVERNRVRGSSSLGITVYNGSGPADNNIVRFNTVTTSGKHGINVSRASNQVYGNLCFLNGKAGIQVYGSLATDNEVYSNVCYLNAEQGIFIDSGAGAPDGTILRNNICYLNSGTAIVDNGTGTVKDHNIISDPLFVNPGAADFRLLSGSPAIGAGADLSAIFTTDFDGTPWTVPWDCGAYKYSSVFVGGSIVLDNFQSGTNSLSSTLAIPITVAAGANRMLVVEVAARDSAPVLHLGVTFDGVALTNRVPTRRQDPLTVSGWTLAAPNPGTHDVVITLSGPANWIYAAVWSLQNVEQTSPIDGVSTTSDPGGSVLSNALTPSVSDVAILDLAVTTAGAGFTMGSLANRTLSDSETSMGDGAAASILNPA